jgi:hypothetical protein
MRNAYIFIVKSVEKRRFGKRRHKWGDNIKMILKEWEMKVWTGFICLRRGFGNRLLWTRKWTFGFHKRGNFLTSWWTIRLSRGTLLLQIVTDFWDVSAERQPSFYISLILEIPISTFYWKFPHFYKMVHCKQKPRVAQSGKGNDGSFSSRHRV